MPRTARRVTTSPEADALDAAAREYARLEDKLERQRAEVIAKAVAAVDAGMSVAEAARRAGYSREHLSKLVNAAREAS